MENTTPLNIRQFNVLVLLILSELYRTFPRERTLNLNGLAADAAPEEASLKETFDWFAASTAAADWLREEGFIRFERRSHVHSRPGDIEDAKLSLKGLSILGSVPQSLSLKPKTKRGVLIDRINSTLSFGAKSAGTEAIKELTKEVIQLALKSFP